MDGQFTPWHWAGTGQEGSIQKHFYWPYSIQNISTYSHSCELFVLFSLFFLLHRGSPRLLRT